MEFLRVFVGLHVGYPFEVDCLFSLPVFVMTFTTRFSRKFRQMPKMSVLKTFG